MHLARSPLYLSLIPGDDEVVGVAYMASLANAPNTITLSKCKLGHLSSRKKLIKMENGELTLVLPFQSKE